MVNYSVLAIPIIGVLVIAGVTSFIIVYSSYPQKHENISIDGKCYELLGMAHQKYGNLTAEAEINKMILQISNVEPNNAVIPIIFNGKDSEIESFMDRHNLSETSRQRVIYFPNINGSVVTTNVPKVELQRIVDNLTIFDLLPSTKSVVGSIGIQPNKYITSIESRDTSSITDKFMTNGLREIISRSDGVKPAECRNNT
jgi:hypothetical protein